MGVFRSEKMLLCQILLSQETVFDCIEVLGNLGLVEFRDLNASVTRYQRRYVTDIRRCEEMERKIRLLEEEIWKSSTAFVECKEIPPAPGAKETLLLESHLESLVDEIQNINKSVDILKRNLLEFVEQHHVLKKASTWLQNNQLEFDEEKQEGQPDLESERLKEKSVGHLKITTGVILLEKIKSFELLVWRICRGVAFIKIIHIQEMIMDPDTDIKVKKAVFIIICQGDSLNEKILKACKAFHCNLYPCPSSDERKAELEEEAVTGIRETEQVMQQTMDHRRRILLVAATNVERWKLQVIKLKSIYHVMNMLQLDETNEFQSAECWLPQNDIQFIRQKLNMAAERFNSQNNPIIIVMKHNENPPTFNRTNKFTKGFQSVIDAYGVSNYREINPMPFTIVTFPFLFAIMFGDIGQGLVLIAFACVMILHEGKLPVKNLKSDIQMIFFKGRYIILLMGLFTCYTGLIYNDFFSKSLNLFGSSWTVQQDITEIQSKFVQLDPSKQFNGRPYLFGIDPVWQASENKIIFLNSFKMKISIIFGVLHMFFGILLNLGNHLYFFHVSNVYTELIPQVVYFSSLFLYLVYLIFFKWIMYGPQNGPETGTYCAPNLLLTFINMILFKKVPVRKECTPMFPNQEQVQKILVTIALICVPWLFAAKSVFLLMRNNIAQDKEKSDTETGQIGMKAKEENNALGEIIINQAVHTIEFVLGSVSHTASYLRLWALSLAHAQLSDVLWKMVFRVGIASRGLLPGLMISITFAIWAVLTVAILALMEGLSAFLHTLRLHWVEFQTKFYSGNGYSFKPYSFEKIFDQQEAVEDYLKYE
ncbi:hypothetical protein RUM43_012058 [Polyplax serrata]|uniref:V-type proton ATPase subunit a n=1 Tax=Polyplax serrata TaxID=468196 RepID=A0AAN8P1Z7_POLSC